MRPFPWKVVRCIYLASLSLEDTTLHLPCLPFPWRHYPAFTMPPFPWKAVPLIYHVFLSLKGTSLYWSGLLSLEGSTLHCQCLLLTGRYYPCICRAFPSLECTTLHLQYIPFPGRYCPAFTMSPFLRKGLPCIHPASLSLEGATLHWPCLPFTKRTNLHLPCLPFPGSYLHWPFLPISGRYGPAFTMPPSPWKVLPCFYHASLFLLGTALHLPCLLFSWR